MQTLCRPVQKLLATLPKQIGQEAMESLNRKNLGNINTAVHLFATKYTDTPKGRPGTAEKRLFTVAAESRIVDN